MYKIIAIMGEAGSGKDSLMQAMLKLRPDLHEIISCTTRPKRQGEVHGVNYFYHTTKEFENKVLNGEMLECASFNGWLYGTSYESLKDCCVNIGVFNPSGIDSLLESPDVDVQIIRIYANEKTRLLRQLNREESPDVKEIIRRFSADEADFANIEQRFEYLSIYNENGADLNEKADLALRLLGLWPIKIN